MPTETQPYLVDLTLPLINAHAKQIGCISHLCSKKSPKQLHQSPFKSTFGHLSVCFDLRLILMAHWNV